MAVDNNYTVAAIKSRFTARLEQYNGGDSHMLSPPIPLFKDGRFNRDNWNSGQDLRTIMSERNVFDDRLDDVFEAWYVPEDSDLSIGIISSGEKIYEEQRYFIINVIVDGPSVIHCDTYFMSWYKSRGTVEAFTKNNVPITINDYIELLTTLEAGGFFNV